MSIKPYHFYTITADAPFMLAENIFIKGNIDDEFCFILLHNYTMEEVIDIKKDGIFVKNISKPFSNKVFLKIVDARFEGNIASLKVSAIDLEYLLIDSFGNDLLKLSKSNPVYLTQSDKWKRYYLMTIYAKFGFVQPKENEITIHGDRIFSELDFCCEVGFGIYHQWGFIGDSCGMFNGFLDGLADEITFVWQHHDISQKRLSTPTNNGHTLLENLDMAILDKHKIIYC
ncbi:hypothetical protein [Bartonella sp. HY038]|uniref:hypothetical protein n=1 Tax=Bartonella sp. HY038 TaxID=2759660 RepID=UPI0015FADC82|nr:hypothetical protein [Bartonella sp. HY038]